jgi:hypothetical protein
MVGGLVSRAQYLFASCEILSLFSKMGHDVVKQFKDVLRRTVDLRCLTATCAKVLRYQQMDSCSCSHSILQCTELAIKPVNTRIKGYINSRN